MSSRRRRNRTPRQHGAILLVLALLLVILGSWLAVRALSSVRPSTDANALAALAEARSAVLGTTVSLVAAGVNSPGRLPNPDFLDPGEGPANNYDGNSNGGCARSTWTPGATLTAVGGLLIPNIRCLGRLPWQTLGLGTFGGIPQNDPLGLIPWYAISANLVPGCTTLNPGILNASYTAFPPGNCQGPAAQPFPWLTVLDAKGNVVTNRAAVVFILPGPPLPGQNRTTAPLAGPAAYLDTVTVAAGCGQPCVPGTYNNARFNWPDSVGFTFIQCALPQAGSATNPDFTQPYNCNDRISFITIDELMEAAERRAAQYLAGRLRTYYAVNGFFPYAAAVGPGPNRQCQNGLTRGLIPDVAGGSCTHPRFDTDDVPASVQNWFEANLWNDYFYYAVAAPCTQAQPAFNCNTVPGNLVTGSLTNVRAIVIGTGAPIGAAPFAQSKGAAQVRPSAILADYLDSTENTNGDNRFDPTATRTSRSYNDKIVVVAP